MKRPAGRGGDEDISEEEEMYVRNKDEVSEREPEAGIRRQRRLQLDHMRKPEESPVKEEGVTKKLKQNDGQANGH